jgi:hypothetical protein
MFQSVFAQMGLAKKSKKTPKSQPSKATKATTKPRKPRAPKKASPGPSPPTSPSVDNSSAPASVEPESPATIPRRKPQFVSTKGKEPESPPPRVRTRVFLRENSDTSCGSGNERPSKKATTDEDLIACCVCSFVSEIGEAWLCELCDNEICLGCVQGLPMAGWDIYDPPEDPAFCPDCWAAKVRKESLRQNRTTTLSKADMPVHLVTNQNAAKLFELGMAKTFQDPKTGRFIDVKGDVAKGKFCSTGMINAFFESCEPILRNDIVVYTNIKPREYPMLALWTNMHEFLEDFYEKETAEMDAEFADVPTPVDSEDDNAQVEEDTTVDSVANFVAAPQPDNVLNGPFGGPAKSLRAEIAAKFADVKNADFEDDKAHVLAWAEQVEEDTAVNSVANFVAAPQPDARASDETESDDEE